MQSKPIHLSEEEKFSWARDLVRDEDPVTALVRFKPQPFVERPSLAIHKQLKKKELAEVGEQYLEQLASLEPITCKERLCVVISGN